MNDEYLPAGTIISSLGVPVSKTTFRNWANTGQVRVQRSTGGKRYYHVGDIRRKLEEAPIIGHRNRGRTIGYARVRSSLEQEDLRCQEESIKRAYPTCSEIFTDIGTSIDFNRRGFNALLSCVEKGDVSFVVVTHRDRLCRFGIEMVERILRKNLAQLVVLSEQDRSIEGWSGSTYEELTDDLFDVNNYFALKQREARAIRERRSVENPKVPTLPQQTDHQNAQGMVPHYSMDLQPVCGVVIIESGSEAESYTFKTSYN